jgi:hypothetical protein
VSIVALGIVLGWATATLTANPSRWTAILIVPYLAVILALVRYFRAPRTMT